MTPPGRGLYESLCTRALLDQLDALPDTLVPRPRPLHPADAADRLALHVGRQVALAVSDVPERDRVRVGVDMARHILAQLLGHDDPELPAPEGHVLHAVVRRLPDGRPEHLDEPLIPLLDTTLLTNAPGEPTLWSQLRSEVDSADRIDIIMAFIRRSGITPLLESLRRHTSNGGTLRILTTTYTGSTEARALDELADAGADIRVSYDRTTTRLHAKAWLFHRASGFSTAYVGSSNLTQSAQMTGLEWNVRVSQARNPDVLGKYCAVFDTYWSSGDFLAYDRDDFARELDLIEHRDHGPYVLLSPIELRPLPYQQRLLELIEVSRERGHDRNLLVSATGTGKTVMAALDFARLRDRLGRARLLFVAHREEILDQSLATFRYALRDAAFGEKWVGSARPTRYEHVFASIQSLDRADLRLLDSDHFDVVIVDEFHHAAARSYGRFLDHVRPRQLLGLTATPERSDGLPILHWFDDRIAAELRLWDAIDQQHLAPFMYYGIHDGLDLRDVPWRRGRGYDVNALSNVYSGNDAWARLVIQQVERLADRDSMRALGFCVSVEHARFMADHFRRYGIASVAVWGDSPRVEREAALRDLAAGRTNVVFSVDLFNEGVDVSAVDTVLMLRPTESPTLFLQQLGRGLRKADDKTHCTVLDFVGTHRREFRFDRRYRALLGGSRRDLQHSVERGFPFLPAGCHLELDSVASEIVLRSIREAIPSQWPAKVEELRSLRRERPSVGLTEFLSESGLDLEDVYDGGRGWSDLLEAAGGAVQPSGPHEVALRRAVGRLLHVDDAERVEGWRAELAAAPGTARPHDERSRRLARMLVAQMTAQVVDKDVSVEAALDLVQQHPQVCAELTELLEVLRERIDHVQQPLTGHPGVPLHIHARYTRVEILAAMGQGGSAAKIPSWQAGVYEAQSANAELFAFTLDKTTGGFSPTTRYRDYAISPRLIHWESQSATREDSPTGLRYRFHERDGRSILLFARMNTAERAFWFLGPATYRGHTGERPMAITWELGHPLSGDLYAAFAAAVA
jgi:superfamily II DNA or RNA helicase/HKD family nuclease